MHRVDTGIEHQVHAEREDEGSEEPTFPDPEATARAAPPPQAHRRDRHPEWRRRIEAHVLRLPDDRRRHALGHPEAEEREPHQRRRATRDPHDGRAVTDPPALRGEAEGADHDHGGRGEERPDVREAHRERIGRRIDALGARADQQHLAHEEPWAEAEDEVDEPGPGREGRAEGDEPDRRPEPEAVGLARPGPDEAADDEEEWRAEEHRRLVLDQVEVEGGEEKERGQDEQQPCGAAVRIALSGRNECKAEPASQYREHARVGLHGEGDPGEEAGDHEPRSATPHEVAIEGLLDGEEGEARIPGGIRDIEGRELAHEEGQERRVAERGGGGERAPGERPDEGVEQPDEGRVDGHQEDADRHQRLAEEAEERRVQVEHAGGVAGVEVEVRHLAVRRAGDLVEDQPLVLEVDPVGEKAREVGRRHGGHRERGEPAAHRRPSR